MARYIDADGLIKKVFPYDVVDKKCYTINAKMIYEAIQEAPTADVVPRSEHERVVNELIRVETLYTALKAGFDPSEVQCSGRAAVQLTKAPSEEIAKLIVDVYTMERNLKTAVKLIEGWQEEFGELKDAGIIKGARAIESLTSVHMLTLERYKDTNDANKVSSGDICVICGESVPEGRQVCGMCETGQEFLNKRKE